MSFKSDVDRGVYTGKRLGRLEANKEESDAITKQLLKLRLRLRTLAVDSKKTYDQLAKHTFLVMSEDEKLGASLNVTNIVGKATLYGGTE